MPTNFATYSSLAGKTVFVSGGASGIGAEIVTAFAAQGCRVGFLDLDGETSAALASTTSGEIAYEICDLRDIDALKAGLERLAKRLGPASVLVNNAARDDRHSWTDVTAE